QDPNVSSYYEQRGRFGLSPGVYNTETGGLNIIEGYEDILDAEGKVVGRSPILHNNELTSFLTGFNSQAYNDKEDIIEYSPDGTYNASANRANARYLQEDKQLHDKEMAAAKLANDKELLNIKQ